MRVYTVHERAWSADGDLVLVKEGFAWPAFFLAPVWALWHGMWRTALALFALFAGLFVALDLLPVAETGASAVTLAVQVAVGLWGNDWRRRALARGGYIERGAVLARNREEAERRGPVRGAA